MSRKSQSAAHALLKYESGQNFIPMQAMVDSGDHTTFTITAAPWSAAPGREPVIRPDGLATGGAISPASGLNRVSVAALTAYQSGNLVSLASESLTIARASTGSHKISSIILTDSGTLATEEGADGSAFSESRGADGGPPLIPEGAIELGQVRLSGAGDAAIQATEIYSVPGTHTELYDFPIWNENPGTGEVEFVTALPPIHAGNKPRRVFIQVYTPIFAPLEPTSDFVPPETTYSQSSTQVYGGTIGSSSKSLAQGSFTAYLKDGVTDPIIALEGQELWWQFFPHRLRAPQLLMQATLGMGRQYPAGDGIRANCTLSASGPAIPVKE
ncbi:hypothetical protein LZ24_02527 [Desulfobotulus alkaliphilus]|uniref:Uncharacterized protein n=1 Tax=Desulfobotulus alkaliphilus TaxID=622671 RepID=A0A562RJ30_9BACT|nr:hypothetical protein [Desulfobotulus alkaliphilus]TWI68554.1 hypothetical protein LZ24_02527 [Desulfobotulus alkaliphilus]